MFTFESEHLTLFSTTTARPECRNDPNTSKIVLNVPMMVRMTYTMCYIFTFLEAHSFRSLFVQREAFCNFRPLYLRATPLYGNWLVGCVHVVANLVRRGR